MLERENQQWGEAYNQLQSECNVMRDRGTSSAYSWPSHDMQVSHSAHCWYVICLRNQNCNGTYGMPLTSWVHDG